MVRVPTFKLLAQGKDITAKIKANLLSMQFIDNEGVESDEISFSVSGLYKKPDFGDNLELWLGLGKKSWHCGKFSTQTVTMDFLAQTTQIRATAVNFASPQKEKKRRTWKNTTLFTVAKKIATQNALSLKTSSADQNIACSLQNDVADIDFIYQLAFSYGYLACVKNKTLIISQKDAKASSTSPTPKNTNLLNFIVDINECTALEMTDANRHAYSAVIAQWQDTREGKSKSIKVGYGESIYKMTIPEPKSDQEGYKKAEAKLNELQRGGINGTCALVAKSIRAGGKVSFTNVEAIKDLEFSIKSVTHNFTTKSYTIDLEFEG